MAKIRRVPDLKWRFMRTSNRLLIRLLSQGRGPRRLVLLLTTKGRRSGQLRCTPLQYEQVGGIYYVGSARGRAADWYLNLLANPHVQVQVGKHKFPAQAEVISDAGRIADFLALRLKRHPWMIGLLLRLEGLPRRYTRADLEELASHKALVILHPI